MLQVRKLREAAGLTQAQLAEKAGCTQPTISGIENGSDTTTTTLRLIATALGCDVVDLYERDEPPVEPSTEDSAAIA